MNTFEPIQTPQKNPNVEANQRFQEQEIIDEVDQSERKKERLKKSITKTLVEKKAEEGFQVGDSGEVKVCAAPVDPDDPKLNPDHPDYEGNLEHPGWDGFKP